MFISTKVTSAAEKMVEKFLCHLQHRFDAFFDILTNQINS